MFVEVCCGLSMCTFPYDAKETTKYYDDDNSTYNARCNTDYNVSTFSSTCMYGAYFIVDEIMLASMCQASQ